MAISERVLDDRAKSSVAPAASAFASRPQPASGAGDSAEATRTALVLGWGTALPRHVYRQAELAKHLAGFLDATQARRLRAAFRMARIDTRCSVLPDFSPRCSEVALFDGTPVSTERRMAAFARESPPLAIAAARAALDDADVTASAVTHVLFITCTGFVAPGPDRDLALGLGLRTDVRRLQIGFQGCSAGIVGLRTAAEIVRGDPNAVVLVVAVELASLHFQQPLSEADVRGHALFADGAGAAIVASRPPEGGGGAGPLVRLGESRTRLVADSAEDMSWEVGSTGFRMGLSSRVPDVLAAALPGFAAELGAESATHWVIHPGGPVILDRVASCLELPEDAVAISRRVLRRIGNVSSATVFFVFRELLETASSGHGIAMAFGPGLTAEGLRFEIEGGP
jgi:predicted naringenin-chalcone synthase